MRRKPDMRPARPLFRRSLAGGSTGIQFATMALILNWPLSQAQSPGRLAEFEVASIKPGKTNERMYYGLRGASLTVRNITLKGLIQIACGKREFQVTGGPGWITSEYFDIRCKS
jgi:hypothetical protein